MGEKAVVDDIGVGLQIPFEALQKRFRTGTFPRRRVIANHSRDEYCLPHTARFVLVAFAATSLTGSVVGSDHSGRQAEVFQTAVKRIEQPGALPHPSTHGLYTQLRAEAPEDLRLTMQRS
jgi:hypothetical protein